MIGVAVLCRKKGGLTSGKPGVGKTTQERAELTGMAGGKKTRIPGPDNQNGMKGWAMRQECDLSPPIHHALSFDHSCFYVIHT